MTAVLAFQFAGWAYQPPAGDQTCFGYLGGEAVREASIEPLRGYSYGIFPPPPIVESISAVLWGCVSGASGEVAGN